MIFISAKIETKIKVEHDVTCEEVNECIENRCMRHLIDDREEHRTNPATMWFISDTNKGRQLKIVFIVKDGKASLKSAYEPNYDEFEIFERKSEPLGSR